MTRPGAPWEDAGAGPDRAVPTVDPAEPAEAAEAGGTDRAGRFDGAGRSEVAGEAGRVDVARSDVAGAADGPPPAHILDEVGRPLPAEGDAGPTDREARTPGQHLVAMAREFVIVSVIALALSFLVKTFLIQAFFIPSESMEDTLVEGDRVIVSKFTPDLVDLHRGDIVVFADPGGWLSGTAPRDDGAVLTALRRGLTFVGLLPDTAEGHLIKRVIGLPGDRVACCDAQNKVTVNGTPIAEPYIKPGEQPSALTFEVTVPAGRVWVMGDNRGHSSDSRLHDPSGDGSDGSVPIDLIVGRAFVTVWPLPRIALLPNYHDTFAHVPNPSPVATAK